MGAGDYPTLESCQFAVLTLAIRNEELVDPDAATYECGRECRRLSDRISDPPFVCADTINGSLRSITEQDWFPGRYEEWLREEEAVRRENEESDRFMYGFAPGNP